MRVQRAGAGFLTEFRLTCLLFVLLGTSSNAFMFDFAREASAMPCNYAIMLSNPNTAALICNELCSEYSTAMHVLK